MTIWMQATMMGALIAGAIIFYQQGRIETLREDLHSAELENLSLGFDNKRLVKQAKRNQSIMKEWEITNNEIIKRTEAMVIELQSRRSEERKLSLLRPFEAGNDSDARLKRILLRFSGHGEGDHSTISNQGGDATGANGARSGETAP